MLQTYSLQLFLFSQFFVSLFVPLVAFTLTWGMDRRAAIWFSAGIYYSFYILLLSLREHLDFLFGIALPTFILWSYIGILVHVLRNHLKQPTRLWFYFPVAALVTGLQCFILTTYGQKNFLVVQSFLVLASDGYLAYLAIRAGRHHHSRSLYIVALATSLVAAVQILRIHELLWGSGTFHILEFTWKTNALVISHLLGIIAVNLGYVCFVIEQAEQREIAITAERESALRAQAVAEYALKERDHMLLINSRFLTLTGISFFTAAIVHELTQPLQTLNLMKVRLIDKYRDMAAVADDLYLIGGHIDECEQIIMSLRQLIATGRDTTDVYDLSTLIHKLIPILRSECELAEIDLAVCIIDEPALVRCNAVLFQRIVFNLIGNCVQAIRAKAVADRGKIVISSQKHDETIELQVWSNAGPAPDLSELTISSLVGSSHPDGIGLGLALCTRLAQQWGGSFSAETVTVSGLIGACFTLSLPVQPSESTIG